MYFISSEGVQTEAISVQMAKTGPERSKGLMYRRELAENVGMLFYMPEEVIQSFWMKNTYVPLDMIFISSDLSVNTILKNVAPLTTTPRKSNAPSKYVLELIGGSADKLGIGEGSKMVMVGD